MLHPWYTCAIFSHWSTSVLGSGIKPVLDEAKTLELTHHLPKPECYFLPCLWNHTLEANKKWYTCSFYRESCGLQISRIGERAAFGNTLPQAERCYANSKSANGRWNMGEEERKALTEDRSKTFPEWNRVQLQWRHLVVQHPNVRGRLSATELPKVERKSTGLQGRKEAWKSENAHTHIHMRVFKLFDCFFNNFSVVFFTPIWYRKNTNIYRID